MIYDRIDLITTGTWSKNFRPNGVALQFGNSLDGGNKYTNLTDVVLPYGAIADGVTLSTINLGGGVVATGGVRFSSVATAVIPYGVKFTTALTIGGGLYPAGIFNARDFLMNTIQLADINNKAIFSVHNIASNEQIAFVRPTADIRRLIMYKNGIGIDSDVFCCYSIVFKTNLTLADIINFNKLHPSDLNPIIIDDGSTKNSTYLIPQ
jgi:hypothetical protein